MKLMGHSCVLVKWETGKHENREVASPKLKAKLWEAKVQRELQHPLVDSLHQRPARD